ncbi:MAG: LuxR C-terminal-related transcriptional regulator [Deltaproteobacteria bacterium]
MSSILADFVDDLRQTASPDEAWRRSHAHLEHLGFDRVIYTFRRDDGSASRTRSTMPDWWTAMYADRELVDVDPFFTRCCNDFESMVTGSAYLMGYPFLSDEDRELVDTADAAGFTSGFAVPMDVVGRPWVGGWNIGGDLPRREAERYFPTLRSQLRVALAFAHERIRRTVSPPESARITPRERECLQWLAAGDQLKQIAMRLGISYATVEFHLRNARRRLGAITREQALARALCWGLIEP